MSKPAMTAEQLKQPTFADITAAEHALLDQLETLFITADASDGDEVMTPIEVKNEHERLIGDLIAALEHAHVTRDAKLDRMCAARRILQSKAEHLTDEAKRLTARANRQLKAVDWIDSVIQSWMVLRGIDRVETHSGANKITLAYAGREPVEVVNEARVAELPHECLRIVPARIEVDKNVTFKALKAGLRAEVFDGIVRLGQKAKRLVFS